MEEPPEVQLTLLNALERAYGRGLVREFRDFEEFAGEVLTLIGKPDTPVNRAMLGAGSEGSVEPLMKGAGADMTYFLAIIPPTAHHAAGSQFFLDRPETDARILLVVVPEEDEAHMAARRRTQGPRADSP